MDVLTVLVFMPIYLYTSGKSGNVTESEEHNCGNKRFADGSFGDNYLHESKNGVVYISFGLFIDMKSHVRIFKRIDQSSITSQNYELEKSIHVSSNRKIIILHSFDHHCHSIIFIILSQDLDELYKSNIRWSHMMLGINLTHIHILLSWYQIYSMQIWHHEYFHNTSINCYI